jgi:hypothetical protein
MMAVSDGVVIGIVLGLVFAAVSYYLYTRMSQLEKKVGYMEGILLDLKVTTEQAILSATEPSEPIGLHPSEHTAPADYHELKHHDDEQSHDQPSRIRTPVATPTPTSSPVHPSTEGTEQAQQTQSSTSLSSNYESMTYKELQQLARQRNISGIRNLSKAQVIEIIRSHDNGTAPPQVPSVAPTPLTAWKSDEGSQGTSIEHLSSMDEAGSSTGLAPIHSSGDIEPEMSMVGNE